MEKIINNFSIRVATVNGTGSQSANTILFKSLFRMGVGVCAKNLFPSNIQGLPTWFQIRVSPQGYQNLREHDDIAILMNKVTYEEDFQAMRPGTTVLYNSNIIHPTEEQLKDKISYALPVEELSKGIKDPSLTHLLKNLFYVGALTVLYKIDETVIRGVIKDNFKSKQKAIDANIQALEIGMNYASQNYTKKDAYEFQKGNVNDGKIIMDGNTAAALGSIFGGCTVYAWYPITPSSSLAETAASYLPKLRTDGEGKAKYAVIQAEDELASAGMVIGAGWAGARALTTTSGPGVSLMNEFIGLAYYAEVPCVFVDVQRVGPSTGLPTRTQQCDTLAAAFASHGDTKHILLFPSTVSECFELTQEAFELADKFQTPIFIMTDLDLGMNNWVDKPVTHKPLRMDKGKVLSKEDLDKVKEFGRYLDVDKDGICYRTLPGTDHDKAAFFTRGSGHDEYARYTESPSAYTRNMDRLLKKWQTSRKFVPKAVQSGDPKSKVGLIAYGTSDHAVKEMMDRMNKTSLKYLRIRSFPFGQEVEEFIKSCDKVYVIEQNRDAQLKQLLETDIRGYQNKMDSILYYGGFPLSADTIERELKKKMEG